MNAALEAYAAAWEAERERRAQEEQRLAEREDRERALLPELRRQRARPARLHLSFREAAKLLGVDRGRVLPELVARGLLRTVDINGKSRIPRGDVERLAEEGFDVGVFHFRTSATAIPRSRGRRRRTSAAAMAANIREMRL